MTTPGILPPELVLSHLDALVDREGTVQVDASIFVRGGLIAAVGPQRKMPACPTIDCTGFWVIPGLINCHTHIEDAGFAELAYAAQPGRDILYAPDGLRHQLLRNESDEHFCAATRSAGEAMLSTGTVMAADFCTGGARAVARLKAALHGSPIEWLHFTGHSEYPVQSGDALARNVDDLPAGVVHDIETTLTIADGFAPVHVNHTTDRGLRTIHHIVKKHAAKRLATHVAASSRYGRESLLHTGLGDVRRAVDFLGADFVVHATYAEPSELTCLADKGIPIVMCPRAMASLGRRLPPYGPAEAAGALVALGTDNAMTTTSSMLDEMSFAARCYGGGPVNRKERIRGIFQGSTLRAAECLGVADRLGSIEPGKEATLVLFDARGAALRWSQDPLASIVLRATAEDVSAVLVRGGVVHGSLPNMGGA